MNKYLKYLIPAFILMAGIFYFFADPNKSLIMPKCVLKDLTGYQCPSCGAQRAIHAFLHGHFIEAVSCNLFFVIAIPLLLLIAYATFNIKKEHPSDNTVKIYNIVTHRYTLLSYVFLYFAWWILRNVIGC